MSLSYCLFLYFNFYFNSSMIHVYTNHKFESLMLVYLRVVSFTWKLLAMPNLLSFSLSSPLSVNCFPFQIVFYVLVRHTKLYIFYIPIEKYNCWCRGDLQVGIWTNLHSTKVSWFFSIDIQITWAELENYLIQLFIQHYLCIVII